MDIKNRTCYYFDDIIKTEDSNLDVFFITFYTKICLLDFAY